MSEQDNEQKENTMGMDLITVGWTSDETFPLDKEKLQAFINTIPDAELVKYKHVIDSAGRLDYEEDRTDAETLRDWLLSGAYELSYALTGRLTNSWQIPGTSLRFYVTGAGSWGDLPFDGYDNLCMLLDAHTVIPELAEYTGVCLFDGNAIPSLEQMRDHAADRCEECGAVIRVHGAVEVPSTGHHSWCRQGVDTEAK